MIDGKNREKLLSQGNDEFPPTFMHFDNYEDKFGHKTFQIRDYRKEK